MANLAFYGNSSLRHHDRHSTHFIIRKVNLTEEVIKIIYWYTCFSASDKFQQSWIYILRKDHEQSKPQPHLKLTHEVKKTPEDPRRYAEGYFVLVIQLGFQYN